MDCTQITECTQIVNIASNVVLAVFAAVSAAIAVHTLRLSFQRKAEISFSYAALEDPTIPRMYVRSQNMNGGDSANYVLNNVALYAVFAIRNIGNNAIALDEMMFGEKNNGRWYIKYHAPALKSINKKLYKITDIEQPIYQKVLDVGEFCELYWPLFDIDNKHSVVKTNEWIAALGGSITLSLDGENDDAGNGSVGKSEKICSCDVREGNFLMRFGNYETFVMRNPKSIDAAIMAAKDEYFFRFPTNVRRKSSRVKLNGFKWVDTIIYSRAKRVKDTRIVNKGSELFIIPAQESEDTAGSGQCHIKA